MSNEPQSSPLEPSQPLAVATGSRFRLLTHRDHIRVGDECLCDDSETWERINGGPTAGESWMIGMLYNRNFFKPMRRAVGSANTAYEPTRQKTTDSK